MDESPDLETLNRMAFEKIGRNVVNLQRMEAALKFLISRSDICCPADEVEKHVEQAKEAVSKKTMGMVVEDFFATVFVDSPEPEVPEDQDVPWVAFRYCTWDQKGKESSADFNRSPDDFKRSLRELVKERNNLIHHDLIKYDFTSAESCRELIEMLDQQNTRLCDPYDRLMKAVRGFIETQNGLAEILQQLYSGSGDHTH